MRQFKNTKLVHERSIINKRKILEQDIRCQPMVVHINSTLKGIPSLGCGGEGNFIQCKQLNCIQNSCENSMAIEQLNSGTAQLWNNMAVDKHSCEVALGWGGPWVSQPFGEAPLRQGNSALFQSVLLWPGKMSFSSQRNRLVSLWWEREVCSLTQRGTDSYREKL